MGRAGGNFRRVAHPIFSHRLLERECIVQNFYSNTRLDLLLQCKLNARLQDIEHDIMRGKEWRAHDRAALGTNLRRESAVAHWIEARCISQRSSKEKQIP